MNAKTIPINLFLFTAPLSVCTIAVPMIGNVLAPLVLLITVLFYLLYSKRYGRIYFSKIQSSVLDLYFLPLFFSLLSACIVLFLKNDPFYYKWFTTDMMGRLAHVVIFLIIFVLTSQIIILNKKSIPTLTTFLESYAYGIFVILGLFGVWQIISTLTGIWCPEVGTRDQLYFSSSLNIKRITSLADEPSYLVPFLFDAFFVFLFLGKQKIAWLLIGLVLFSLSFAGFMELFLLAIFMLILSGSKHKVKIIVSLGLVLVILFIAFRDIAGLVFEIMSSRKELQSGFSMEDTGRTAMIVYPIKSFFREGNVISVLFGNGPGSFKYLFASHPDCIFPTSNNLYADVLYEGGLISLACIGILMLIIWRMFSRLKSPDNRYEILIVRLFLLHFALTAFYRGDYVSEHFFAVILVIEIFYLILANKHDKRYRSDFPAAAISE